MRCVATVDRHHTAGTGLFADVAIRIADGPAIGNLQRADAKAADGKPSGTGPRRIGAAGEAAELETCSATGWAAN
jgi:hypothetical protein